MLRGTQQRFVRSTAPPTLAEGSVLVTKAINGAKAGDPSALHFLYVRYADTVRTYVEKIVRDNYEAEDITQTLFADLMKKIRRYQPGQVPFDAWLLRVARNAALDNLRGRRSIPFAEVRTSEEGTDQIRLERCEALKSALEQLPAEQREVLVLRHIACLSPSEIAERLAKSESSIHGLHHRGRRALKAALRDFDAAPVTAIAS